MKEKYEINQKTLAVVGLKNGNSKVIEYDTERLLEDSAYQVMDYSCSYFGSSYQGRMEGTKRILGYNYKVPIIIEESSSLIFFPSTSPSSEECIWFSLDSILNIIENNYQTIITLKNGTKIESKISKSSLENQILRATRLKCVLNDRKEAKK